MVLPSRQWYVMNEKMDNSFSSSNVPACLIALRGALPRRKISTLCEFPVSLTTPANLRFAYALT
jgi:hypothetical protein